MFNMLSKFGHLMYSIKYPPTVCSFILAQVNLHIYWMSMMPHNKFPQLAANHLENKDIIIKYFFASICRWIPFQLSDRYKGVKCQLLHLVTGQPAAHPGTLRSISHTLSYISQRNLLCSSYKKPDMYKFRLFLLLNMVGSLIFARE